MAQVVKNPPCGAGDSDLIPGSGRSPGEGNGNPLQYSCLENPTDRGAWWAIVNGVARSWTRLSTHAYMGSPSNILIDSQSRYYWVYSGKRSAITVKTNK